jgi:hypothetical protein
MKSGKMRDIEGRKCFHFLPLHLSPSPSEKESKKMKENQLFLYHTNMNILMMVIYFHFHSHRSSLLRAWVNGWKLENERRRIIQSGRVKKVELES